MSLNLPRRLWMRSAQQLQDIALGVPYLSGEHGFSANLIASVVNLYFAKVADLEGQPEVAELFSDAAEGETGHAHGHLDYLKQVGDPTTDLPIGDSLLNLKAAVHGETYEYTDMYPGMAKTARDEGFAEIAD